jgi:hypothetical protein
VLSFYDDGNASFGSIRTDDFLIISVSTEEDYHGWSQSHK